jgi:TRAP-type C4-dicarboxylate transport system permease small subunit
LSTTTRAVLILLCTTIAVLLALLCSGTVGWLSRIDGATPATAIRRAGVTFAASLTLTCTIVIVLLQVFDGPG